MKVSILTFDGFNELDSFIALGILNRMRGEGWQVNITAPSTQITSMNGVTIEAQQQLEYANEANIVLFGSGIYTRDITQNSDVMNRLSLNPETQLIGSQCSGTYMLAKLGLLRNVPACTDLTTKPWVIEAGVEVLNQPFYAKGNVATSGGCMASQYLATWALCKKASEKAAREAIHYVAPVGEKEETVERSLKAISAYI
ncbi:DJ-1/PfpI family protein [Curvivirga aplysinae]|uniref:DJ-1/PfpI family protein n=1 Tax=Curvivirga aplysinae TaxID=2529852 RepID=UPI0012BBB82B|nr:DJ-1/PfpI family protein [Curvivirga aplysinae]MTI10543.1 AraC family transcriptional regulator [Curvivirga aplysinae]